MGDAEKEIMDPEILKKDRSKPFMVSKTL